VFLTDSALKRQSAMQASTEMVTVNGVGIFTRSIGEGPSEIVVLHGGPSATHISLSPAIDELARGRQLHYYDQRGCGESSVSPRTPLDWRNHVDDLRGLVDLWQIDKATILGHSWGALLGLLFAIQNPDRVARLLLVAPASIKAVDRHIYLERLNRRVSDLGIVGQQRELIQSDLRRSDPKLFRQRAFELSLAPYLKDPTQLPPIAPFQISHRVRGAVWRSLGDYDLTDALSGLSISALVIHGRYDPIPVSSSKLLAKQLRAPLEIFENSGHMPFFEEQEHFLRVVEGFLPCGHGRKNGIKISTAED
jgi:proline iminopeptidase